MCFYDNDQNKAITQKIFGRNYMPNACLMYSSTTTPQLKGEKI